MNPVDPSSIERRPLATRERRSSQWVAGILARAGMAPNAISLAGLMFGIAAGVAFAATAAWPAQARWWWIAGAALVQLRLASNMLDGMVALAAGASSPVGELYNEIPDRVTDAAILAGLGYALHSEPVLGWLAACVALFVAYVRAEGKAAGARQEFCGPMAKPQRMFIVTAAALYCGLAPAAWQPILGARQWGLAAIALLIIIFGGAITAARRIHRIASTLKAAKP
ncbi:MAG: CDP-alcohol phosphatidyltransferase family protein [Candidatus Sumerlaeota bacterium]|nr:CDP-alcohol phosphatidyltransferase family protein [Candidatus Sumerlaeota bacterium]